MNILLIIVMAIIAACAFAGYSTGLIKTVFSMLSVIAALVITAIIAPAVSTGLKSSDNIMGYFTEKIGLAIGIEEEKYVEENQEDFINSLELPDGIKKLLVENNINEVYKSLEVDKFKDYVTTSIAGYIISAVSFLGVFIVAVIGLRIAAVVLDLISRLPILNGLNKTAGLAVGAAHGIVIVWVLMAVITAFGASDFGASALSMISDSKFLGIIYDYNPVTKYLLKISKF